MIGACVDVPVTARACDRGRARSLDDDDGACLTTRDTRDLARTAGVYVDENDFIECEAKNDELVASARLGKIGCLAKNARPPSCPPEHVRVADACAPLVRGGTIDLGRFAKAAAEEACARLARSPLALTSPETSLEVELQVSAPNNDLTLAFARLRSKPPAPEPDAARVSAAVDDAVRRIGGSKHREASTSEASAAASCRASMRRPISVP